MKNQKGFSLIELLIVVVIIGIIAAIAIPNLLASRRAANEGSAQSTLRTIHSAEATYFATAGNGAYGTLPELGGQGLVDRTLSKDGATKSGYVYNVALGETPGAATGDPATPNGAFAIGAKPTSITPVTATGTRNFCVGVDGVLLAGTVSADSMASATGCSAGVPIGSPAGTLAE